MASAAASRPPAPPPPPPPPAPASASMQWLSPRVSFSLDDAGGCGGGRDASADGAAGGGGAGKASADFEFFLAGSTMLPADELFSGGKLVPLRIPSSSGSATEGASTRPPLIPATQPETPRAEEAQTAKDVAETVEQAAEEEPKVVPARRWRDLLRMRKQQASPSSSATDTKPLRRLLRRGPKPPEQEPSLSLPLLREPDEKPETKPAQAPAATPTPTPPPPASQQQQQHHHQQLPPKIRLTAAAQATAPPPPPPPPAVAADSPRLNAAGKVMFNGLGRSSSSPSSLAGGRRHRSGSSGSMERSYSAHVRVTPVLNVPVCRKSVSVFGIDRLFSPSSASTAAAAAHAAAKKGRVAKTKEVAATTTAPSPPSQ